MSKPIPPPWQATRDRKAKQAGKALPPPPYTSALADADLTFEVDPNWGHVQTRTKAARRVFIAEYIKDFNATKAALRTGYCSEGNAASCGCRWLAEPFTQWLLAKMLDELKEDHIVTRTEILVGLKREACSYEPGAQASRVKAWATLAKLKGMEVIKVEGDIRIGGKVLTVPLASSPEEYEILAKHRQATLKKACSSAKLN